MMIGESQRATIFAQLQKKRKWTGRKNGYRVRIWTEPSQAGVKIHYQVTKRHHTVHGQTLSVSRTIDAVEATLDPQPLRISAPERVALVAAATSNYRLPYADN